MNRALFWQRRMNRPTDGSSWGTIAFQQVATELMRGWRRVRDFFRIAAAPFRGAATGAAASEPAATLRYRDLLDSIVFPERLLPLTRFERAVERETSLTEQMARMAAAAVADVYVSQTANGFGCAMRDQHAKAHGCVDAEMIVRHDLPAEFTTRLFRPGARHRAILRFSNGNAKCQSDRSPDARGLSIKLLDVEGDTILPRFAPIPARGGQQDFLFSSFPVFFCKNVVDYTAFMEGILAPRDSWREKLSLLWRWICFIARYPRQIITFLKFPFVTFVNPLEGTYHSMSPYLFGDDHIVRYIVTRTGRGEQVRPWWSIFSLPRSPSFLKEALLRELTPPGDPVELDFSIRVRHAPQVEDAENALQAWTKPLDRTVRLATLRIPRQHFDTPDQRLDGERMTFNPWNCLPEHRPVGSINRMRLAVYLASLQVRQKLNMAYGVSGAGTGPAGPT